MDDSDHDQVDTEPEPVASADVALDSLKDEEQEAQEGS